MKKAEVLVDQRFGQLLVVSRAGSQGGKATWNCVCDCGGMTISTSNNLKSGGARSCGCAKTKHGHTVGGVTSRTFKTWHSLLGRCLDPKHRNYHRYGGRGITVCDKWLDFSGFLSDMGERPAGMTLDRIDNDGPYSKENCRWATLADQSRNKSTNRWVTIGGDSRVVTDWGVLLNIPPPMFYSYASRHGVSLEDAVLHYFVREKK